MRWPSAYCATSSGMDMINMRASTQPTLPSLVRTRFQSSNCGAVADAAGWGVARAERSAARGFERSCQLRGGDGGTGMGGACAARTSLALDFFEGPARLTGGGMLTGSGAAEWGARRWPITSTDSPSEIWKKLGDWRAGALCMFRTS